MECCSDFLKWNFIVLHTGMTVNNYHETSHELTCYPLSMGGHINFTVCVCVCVRVCGGGGGGVWSVCDIALQNT